MTSRTRSSEEAIRQAHSNFTKTKIRQQEAAQAMEREAIERQAQQAKTLRLRALRLAKEADEALLVQQAREAADRAAATAAPKRRREKAKR
ncbi:hypothetical protein [Labrys wisconsinensis]|uniref:D-alanyl-D-alanine dipeptidase n=1 Tax=Labrys wisconsinensis TaxID=425677 RepID=A0ABU0JAE9_9HYPH|nr:hypothetical protein [Labrys wisconsinensis]MDQ0471246.1 D-alanyl-D-alanine dipeptidase [Labrys wisconsinensis]